MERRATQLLLGFAFLLMVGVACKKAATVAPSLTAGRPECPLDSLALPAIRKTDREVIAYTLTSIPVSGPITNVPEYHDCQRFIIAGNIYGPMVAIFAHHALDSLWNQLSDSSTGTASQAAAEIYSFDGDYEPLYIRKGFNCLYLLKAGGHWVALMTWADQDPDVCLKPPFSGKQLTVRPASWHGGPDDLPPVARWDWDPVHHTQYISIRCGSEWCEVGATDFESSVPVSVTLPPVTPVLGMNPTTAEKHRVVRVRGWYDEQYLAMPGVAGLQPSTIRGTAIPSPLLQRLTTEAQFANRWTESAYILLDSPPQSYSSKLGLDAGLNRIAMCFGDFKDCPHPTDVPEPSCKPEADHKWWAAVTPQAGGTPKFFCVTRRTHPGVEIPGAVRWRWDPDDEKTWIRCPQGCCTVS